MTAAPLPEGAAADPVHAERPRLFAIAYRMLGSVGEAEDVVQEAFLRWFAVPRDEVQSPPAFLTTMVTNLCLDELKRARRRRERYPGVWLPEPLPGDADDAGNDAVAPHAAAAPDPQDLLDRLESVSLAFLSMLDALSPLERAVWLLAEVFDYPHAEVAAIVGRSEAACRQALRRARAGLAAGRRLRASPARHEEMLRSFIGACRLGDVGALERLLADDVVARGDGGGLARAANRPLVGARAVARLYAALSRRQPPGALSRVERVNGWPALLIVDGARLLALIQLRTDGERITRIDAIVNPAKLARLAASLGLEAGAR